MASPNSRVSAADTEAAAWHARLGVRSVSTRTIEEFFAWRALPANAEAYRRVEKAWAASGGLGGDPQIQAAVAEAMNRRGHLGLKARYQKTLFAIAAATAVVALSLGAWFWSDSRSVISTAVGQQRVVQLADGSTVRLDTGSTIRVRLVASERRIELERGQALFTVAHDPARPFIVDAGDTEVTAVGTVFDVRRIGRAVRVTLVEGAVDVTAATGAPPSRMRAGQQARVTAAGVSTRIVDTAKATSWTDGRLVFEDTPLREAVAEVNRYLEDPIALEGAVMADVPVNGVFRAGDRAAFASAAAEGLGLEARKQADGTLLLSRRINN
ncbi:MAG: FecR domain-containing protein [Brevundimonas sp.]|uniref:FecR family protein n=1 Tax=Brevundimonas sp. TaxID=1871086 RepID=UPI002719CA6F|nr:FecR domain-containing protein [Brevundimonas sp.]MDO9587381.1 FecR domain-containing protein [Brevundimonas sp.]